MTDLIAVDTNVVLRLIVGDDELQRQSAVTLLRENRLFVSLPVYLETGWVLESRYAFSRAQTADALKSLSLLRGVIVARQELVDWALGRYESGGDLADMIHLVAAAKHGRFATFDRRLARAAGSDSPFAVQTLA